MNVSSGTSDGGSSKKSKKNYKKGGVTFVTPDSHSKIIANFNELQSLLESWHFRSDPPEAEKMRDLLLHIRHFLNASSTTNTDSDFKKFRFLAETIQIFQDKYQQSAGEVTSQGEEQLQDSRSISAVTTTPHPTNIINTESSPTVVGTSSNAGLDDQRTTVANFYTLEEINKQLDTCLPNIEFSESDKIIDLLIYLKNFLSFSKDGGGLSADNGKVSGYSTLDGTINKFLEKHFKPGSENLHQQNTPRLVEPPKPTVSRVGAASTKAVSGEVYCLNSDFEETDQRSSVINPDRSPSNTRSSDLQKVVADINDLGVALLERSKIVKSDHLTTRNSMCEWPFTGTTSPLAYAAT